MKILRNATGVQKIQFQLQHMIALIFNMHVYTIKPVIEIVVKRQSIVYRITLKWKTFICGNK